LGAVRDCAKQIILTLVLDDPRNLGRRVEVDAVLVELHRRALRLLEMAHFRILFRIALLRLLTARSAAGNNPNRIILPALSARVRRIRATAASVARQRRIARLRRERRSWNLLRRLRRVDNFLWRYHLLGRWFRSRLRLHRLIYD